MSRVGVKPIEILKGAKVTIDGRTVRIEGPKGTLTFEHREHLRVGWSEDEKSLVVGVADGFDKNEREVRALWGTTRAVLNNMIIGVTQGYKKSLEIVGVGWNAQMQGNQLKLVVGYANPIMMTIPEGLNITVDKQIIHVEGADKALVGEFAASARAKRKPEPYNGKGIKYSDEVIRRKEGKAV